jgi:hypothetical protein
METINLTKLEQSVSKISDLIDLTLDNLNPDFLVDNFKKDNILKNTKLRKEFNQLCKNKAESKNLEEKSLTLENKKIYVCRENQVRDIPPILNPVFDNYKKLYLMGVPMKNSFIHSIHNIMEKDFILKGPIQKEKILDDFRNKVVLEIDELFKKFHYGQKKFKKSNIRDNLLSSKVFLPQTVNLVCDYFDICLLIIDAESHLFSLGNDYHKDNKFIVMIRKNNTYQPILNTDGTHCFESSILDKIEKVLKPEVEIDKTVNEFTMPTELGKEKDYKLTDLHKISETLNISIYSGGKKRKLKKELYEEIKSKMI